MDSPGTGVEAAAATARGPESSMVRLARLIAAYAPHDGSFKLRLPGVHVIRRSRPYSELAHGVVEPSLCVVAQGAKRVLVGQEVYEYDASRMIAYSVDLPVTAQVTRASQVEPFLCLVLNLDRNQVAELVLRVYPHGLPRVLDSRGVALGQADLTIVAAATRLVELLGEPGAELLAPLVVDEILIRLLLSPIGSPRHRESRVMAARQLRPADEGRRARPAGAYEHVFVPPALQGRNFDEPAAVSEGAAPPGGQAVDAVHDDGRGCGEPAGWVRLRLPVQQGVRSNLR
jgi:hypothetical protein